MGLAYKKNIDDDRESPAYPIINTLKKLGGIVKYHDPLIPEIPETRKYNVLKGETSASFDNTYDAYILVTNHDMFLSYEYENIRGVIIDTRGMLRGKGVNARNA